MYLRLEPPPQVLADAQKEVREVEQYFKARKLGIGKGKRDKLDKWINRMVEAWEAGTPGLRKDLKELNDLLEGFGENVDFPFGSGQSSSIDIRYAAAKARTLRASFVQAVFADPGLLVAETLPGARRGPQDNLAEAAVNWTASKETNGIETLKDTPVPAFRDGTALVYGEWERRIERGVDYRTYESVEQFTADYPTAKAAGLTKEKYNDVLDELAQPDEELHVEFSMDFVAQNGPAYTIFPLAKFIWGPLSAKDLRLSAEIYGYYYTQTAPSFDAAVAYNFYDKEQVEQTKKRSSSDVDEWERGRDTVEGITSDEQDRATYKIARLVVSYDLDDDDIPERYMVYWDMEGKRSLRVEQYGLWRNTPCIVPFRLLKRDDRFLGVSLLRDGRDLFRELNALHRHRSNTRRLTDSVTLIIPKALKEDVDLGAEYAEFKPGMTLWVPNDLHPDKYPKQLQIYNLSRSGDSVDEEGMIVRYIDGLIGVSEGQSGRESTGDPNAPASKTRMLLARADLRVEDLVEEWKRSIPDFADLHVALYLANAKAKLKFMAMHGGELRESEVATQVLADPKRRFGLKVSRNVSAPEMEMNKLMALVAAAFQLRFPVMAKPQMIIEIWNDYVTASRIDQPERFMIEAGENGQATMGGQPVQVDQLGQQLQQMVAQMEMQKRGVTSSGGATK